MAKQKKRQKKSIKSEEEEELNGDARKKRVSDEIQVKDQTKKNVKSKKLKGSTTASLSETNKQSRQEPDVEQGDLTFSDIESAIEHLCSGKASTEELDSSENGPRSLKYRTATASDAAQIQKLYKAHRAGDGDNDKSRTKARRNSGGGLEDSVLELQLAEAFGDEDTPPFLYGLVAELYSQEKLAVPIGGVALFNRGKDGEGADELKVEWFYNGSNDLSPEDAKTVQQHLWLRVSSLALMLRSSIRVLDQSALD